MLRDFAQRRRQETGSLEVESEDFMDDGTPIRLRVQINEEEVGRRIYQFAKPGQLFSARSSLQYPCS